MTQERKVALVTGASRGIGAAIAQQLVQDGYFVIGTATSEAGAEKLSVAFAENGTGAVLDVRDGAAIDTLVTDIEQKFLIEMVPATANPVGAALPTADYKVTSNLNIATGVSYNGGFNMSAANGKIALANAVSAVTAANGANVVDFIGYGSATMFEGAAAAPLLDATKSATRTAGDTNNNGTDFAALAPTPTNSVLAVSDVNSTKITLVKNSNVNKTIVFGAKANVQIISANGQVVKTAVVSENTNLDVSSLPKGMYIISADVNGQKVSQKIIKN